MANNKNFYFEGSTTSELITREEVLNNSHGTYACLEYDNKGYLGMSDNGEVFIIGCVHSYSAVIEPFVFWLAKRFTEDLIVQVVETGSDLWHYEFKKGVLVESYYFDWFKRDRWTPNTWTP